MTEQQPKQKKALVKLPFPMPNESNQADDAVHNQVRPKPEQYADRTWMPPRGTRRSMGKTLIFEKQAICLFFID
ncbi:hypothetical protein BJI62_04585 [Acinetobacter pittii]|nr:hypothetical protein BJI62_04585 [Acinetobacter pittii]